MAYLDETQSTKVAVEPADLPGGLSGPYLLANYPNPFATTTQFTFEITAPAEVGIKIYTLSGRKIAVIEPEYFSAGYHIIAWDGLDEFGDNIANGAYLYQVTAKIDNKTVSTVNTCAKFR